MQTINARLAFTAAGFRQAWYEGLAEASMKAADLGTKISSTKKGRFGVVAAVVALLGLNTQDAYAANCEGTGATSSIVKLFQNIGVLLYIIGGVFSLVCFAGAAIMFMSSGNNPGRADKAMKWAKNTVIGLAFLAGGFFFRSIIVNFVDASGSVASSTDQQGDAAVGILGACNIPGQAG